MSGQDVPDEVGIESSVWPAVLAAGVVLLLFGVVTSLSFSVVGALAMAGGIWGWIGDLRRG
jgi:hypothetical protein